METIDFVIPVKCNHFLIRTAIESIHQFYQPRNVYIITNRAEIKTIKNDSIHWNCSTKILFIDEDTFFLPNYHLFKNQIENMYERTDENAREFGWWYQQLLKLGSVYQIEGLSDPYIVWDSDLIPLQKWSIYNEKTNQYFFAILQETAKNNWNKEQYAASIKNLIGIEVLEPETGGTFVPHHFVFHHNVLKTFLRYILLDLDTKTWIERIIGLSHEYSRFSEYKTIATFMRKFYPELLHYHPFSHYGKDGIRYRENKEIIEKIKNYCVIEKCGLSYENFCQFVHAYYTKRPSYIQIEHVYS